MDLTTPYMGLMLKNPLIASASPLNSDLGNLRRLEDAGAAAVVLPSIFEEQIMAERREIELSTESAAAGFVEAQTYLAPRIDYSFAPERYLDIVRRAKAAIGIPVIASLNGVSHTGWVDYARGLQQAGADAIELNIYFIPADLLTTGREVEQRYVDVLASVKSAATLPLAMDLELSTPAEIRLPLLWIAILHGRVAPSLAASTGVETADDVFKY